MKPVVVDADVGVKWHLQQHDSDQADRVLSQHPDLHAPHFHLLEVTHVLAKYARLGHIKPQTVQDMVVRHRKLVSHVHPDHALADDALALCLAHGHPFYDCLYLALVVRLDAVLVTADKKLIARFDDTPLGKRTVLLETFAG